ncbi:MAG: hypothetical protein ACYCX5_12575 [Coriobacteriia bacterium]
MKEKFIQTVIVNLMPLFLKLLTPEMLKKWIASGLDTLEKEIKESSNQIDDAALPLLKTLREAVNA